MKSITISIDAMGGDYGSDVIVPAALQVLARHQNLRLILVGDGPLLNAKLLSCSARQQGDVKERIVIQHASEQVLMDEAPAKALRTKKNSSMRVAINLVKDNVAQACVSAGNTGALMATARFVLKMLPGIDRPAIIVALPTIAENKVVRVLDLGANIDCDASHLYQFAIMGVVLSAAVDKIAAPKVGLLNVGLEEIKGNDQVKQAAKLLSENKRINYIGYVEGDDIFKGNVDVVVCDGFTGNAVLKSVEGISKLIIYYLKKAFLRNIFTKIVAFLSQAMLKNMANQLDPGRHNGASLIGLQGIVIKSHGSANVNAFAHAIDEAILEVEKNVPQLICDEVGRLLNKA